MAVLALGCGNLVSSFRHGGPDGGGADAGASDAGGADASIPGVDSGTPDGAVPDAGSFDAGAPDAGPVDSGALDAGNSSDGGPFSWTPWPGLTAEHNYYAVSGTGPQAVYIVATSGQVPSNLIDFWDGGTITNVYGNLGNQLHGVWAAPNGEVFAGGQGLLLHCAGGCNTASAIYDQHTFPGGTGTAYGLCGSPPNNAWAVGNDLGPVGVVWRWQSGGWGVYDMTSGFESFGGCWVAPDGSLFVAANGTGPGGVLRYPPGSSTAFAELDGGLITINAVSGNAMGVFAVGDEDEVYQRDANGGWTQIFGSIFNTSYLAAWSVSDNEAFAGGFIHAGITEAHFFDGAWSYLDDLSPPIQIQGIWSADPNTLFMVGVTAPGTGSQEPYLFVGTR